MKTCTSAKPASPGSGLGLGLLSTSALSGPLGPEGAILKRDLMTSLKTMQTHNPANHEQEWYTDGAVTRGSNGEIIIKAEKQNGRITSGKVWTKDVWSTSSDSSVKNHGYVEVRATLPAKVGGGELEGSWPAIWLLGNGPSWPAEGEIDIVEMVNGEPKVYMTTHSPNHHGSYGQHPSGGSPLNCNANFVENELIAGLEWNLHGSQIDLTWWITFFDLSSQSWKSASPNTLVIHKDGSQDYWNFYNTFQNKGFYLIVNLAEGGDWPSDRTFVDGKPQYIHISSAKVYGFKTEK